MTRSHPAGQQLSVDDLVVLLEELYNARAKWYNIGMKLGVNIGTLKAIEKQYLNDPSDCLRETLTTWLKSYSPPPTWSKVMEALNSNAVGEESLATSLKRKYCSSTPPHAPPPSHPLAPTGMTLLTAYVCGSAQSY